MIPLGVLVFYAALRWDVFTDFYKWLANEAGTYSPVDHPKDNWQRSFFISPAGVCFYFGHPHVSTLNGQSLLILANVCLMLFFVWWLAFDGWYNKKRKLKFWFMGSFNDAGHNDAALDKFQRWAGPTASKLIKVLGAGLTVIFYIISFFG